MLLLLEVNSSNILLNTMLKQMSDLLFHTARLIKKNCYDSLKFVIMLKVRFSFLYKFRNFGRYIADTKTKFLTTNMIISLQINDPPFFPFSDEWTIWIFFFFPEWWISCKEVNDVTFRNKPIYSRHRKRFGVFNFLLAKNDISFVPCT